MAGRGDDRVPGGPFIWAWLNKAHANRLWPEACWPECPARGPWIWQSQAGMGYATCNARAGL